MFKRANKITSLLIAAAAVVSLVPANAADVKKIESQDGTVFNAYAYKDGTFFVDGEVADKDENAYFVKDGQFSTIDDVDSGDEAVVYGDKYLEVDGGDYYVDLETGKSTDDSIREDNLDDARTSLRKKLNKDDSARYATTAGDDVLATGDSMTTISSLFAEDWYEDTVAEGTTGANGAAGTFHIYTDVNGNYIDADHNLGKVNAVTTDGAVTLKNTKDDDDAAVAQIRHTATIAQDKDNIYRIAKLTVTGADGLVANVFGSTNREVTLASGSNITVIQKISKAQDSDDIDDAKFAKTVNTYFFTDDSGKDKFDADYDQYAVQDGKLLNYYVDGGKVYTRTIELKSKSGYYYTDITDGADTDVEVNGVQVDVNGNLWALDGGYIKKYNNDDDFDKVYKVDGSFDTLSVYDEDNMAAWSEEDEVYSLIGEKTEAPAETPVVTTGWAQATDGTWTYVKADGTKATGWLNLGGTWYYLKADGVMATGWVQDAGTWYYLAGSGAMQTGWLNDNGTWYYLAGSGAMLANTTVDGYVLGASGAWIK